MSYFTITMCVVLFVCAIGGVCELVRGIEPRTPTSAALNVVFNTGLAVWALIAWVNR